MIIILDKLPIPPSSNQIYRSFYNKKIGRLIHYKSKELKAYETLVGVWAADRIDTMVDVKSKLKQSISNQRAFIRIDAYFGFKPERLWNREGARKKIDVSNRIKALHDALSSLLEIDDRFFCLGDCEPAVVGPWEEECVLIKMTVSETKSMKAVYEQIKNEIQMASSLSQEKGESPLGLDQT
jgi:Holliday junction resolvase RusA-like endonuclease